MIVNQKILAGLAVVIIFSSLLLARNFAQLERPVPAQLVSSTIDTPSTTDEFVSPSTKRDGIHVGEYVDFVGTVRTIAHDCGGGGERCLGYLAVALPEEFRTESMWEARIDLGNCVDATLRGGDVSHVRGIAENIIPDIGIIMNCDSPKTVVFRTTLGSTMETVTSQPAYLINTYENDGRYYVMLDYVEWFRGEGQREAMIEDGVCLPPDCYVAPNGHKRNKNPKLRTLPLAQNVAIDVHGYFASFVNKTYSSNENSRLSVEEFFRSSIQAGEKMFYSGTVFELAKSFVVVDVVNGDVTRISEPYQE